MIRFLVGLILGAAAAGIAWAVTHCAGWALLAGIGIAVLVWLGELLDLDDPL